VPQIKIPNAKMKISTLFKTSLSAAALFLFHHQAHAQISFTNANAGMSGVYHSGNCVSVVDMNSDGLDDLVLLDQSSDAIVEIQNRDGSFTSHFLATPNGTTNAWGMCVGDFDHNGWKDIVYGPSGQGRVIYVYENNGVLTANVVTLQLSYLWQNITLTDVNNDGWLDIFACDDNAPSHLYLNDGTGNLILLGKSTNSLTIGTGSKSLTIQAGLNYIPGQHMYIGFSGEQYMEGTVTSYNNTSGALVVEVTNTVGSGTFTAWCVNPSVILNFAINPTINFNGDPADSGNYGSVWTDFDNDKDLDLYVPHCRQSTSDPNDIRRWNRLFVNDGTGKFTEKGADFGLQVKWQSWTGSFGDMDNDGDFDLMLANHDYVSQILEHTAGANYVDITSTTGFTTTGAGSMPMESIFEDFDNDGFVDILVTGSNAVLYRNNGNKTFTNTNIGGNFVASGMLSFATGDVNHDGKIDLYTSYGNIYNTPTADDDVLYLNTTQNANHFINFQLEGTVSNQGAVGARVSIYGPWGVQMREVRAGESYGPVNSTLCHFGTGFNTTVDSAVIWFPSGITTTLTNLTVDQFVTVIENTCTITGNTVGGTTVLCPGSPNTTLSAANGFATYEWNEGTLAQNLTVSTVGNFSVEVTDGNGCSNISPYVAVQISPDETPTVLTVGETTFCAGGSVTLTSSSAGSYLWNNGETSQTINVSQSGIYHVQVPGACQSWTSSDITVTAISSADAVASNTAVFPGSQAVLTATGDNLQWFDAASGGSLLATGNTFTTPPVNSPTTYFVQSRVIFGADSANVGKVNQTNTGSAFSGSQALNYTIRFDVLQACTINEFTVYTDTVFGVRKVVVKDQATNLTVDSAYIDVQNDTATVAVDLNLQPGSYYITTDAAQNTILWGNGGPRLKRSNSQVNYPYTFPGVLTMTSSDQGTQYYYYFYDWKVSTQPTICEGNMVPVLVDILTGNQELQNAEGISLFPNPTSNQLFVRANSVVEGSLQISFTDLAGRLVQQNSYQNLVAGSQQSINISALSKGVYFVKIKTAKTEYIQRVLIE
jgi:hypothetical protein